jgi:hypothetical protein
LLRCDRLPRIVWVGIVGTVPQTVSAALTLPPASSTSRSATRCAAEYAAPGSTQRSNRRDASLGSLCRRAVRLIRTGANDAASMRMFVVVALSSVVWPPMTPARPMTPESSVMTRSSGLSTRFTSSRVVSVSPAAASRTTMPPARRSAS